MNEIVDRQKVYSLSHDFFDLNGNYIMKLTPEAAIEVCKEATNRNLYVRKIEGGILRNPGFEARVDCLWDSLNDLSRIDIVDNNKLAEEFIVAESTIHDAFIITL